MNNGNTPAAPLKGANGRPYNFRKDSDGGYFAQEGQFFSIGLTKREELSARFMAALLMHSRPDPASAAVVACEYADALLAEWAK